MTTTSKQHRWICPLCSKGVNGPQRPRRDDVRRYCLPCSAKTGRLVERTAPALERARAESRQRSAAKRATRTRTVKDTQLAARSAGPFDLLAEAKRLWNLPVMVKQPRWVPQLPEIEFRRSRGTRGSSPKVRTSGRCYGNGWHARIVLTIGSDPVDALDTVLHELVHAVMPDDEHHGDRFWMVNRSAAREAWPTATFRFNEPAATAYDKQRQIYKGLRELYVAIR